MSKDQMLSSANLRKILDEFPLYGKPAKCYSIKEMSNKISSTEMTVYQEVSKNPDLFLWLTVKKFTTIYSILHIIRKTFETWQRMPIDIETICMGAIRNAFNIKSLNSKGIKTLLNASFVKFVDYYDFVSIETKYYSIYNSFVSDKKKIPNDIFLNLMPTNEDESYISELNKIFLENNRAFKMLSLKVNGKTLNEIGEAEGISRERVRKLIEKPTNLLTEWVYKYEKLLLEKYSTGGVLNEKSVTKAISADKWTIIREIIIANNDNFRLIKYDQTFDIIFKDLYHIDSLIAQIISSDCLSESEYLNFLVAELNDKGYSFLTINNIEKFLSGKHILLPSGKYADGKFTASAAVASVIMEKYPNGIKISDNKSLMDVFESANKKYGINISGSNPIRNIAAKIQSSCYLVDKGTYSAKQPIQIPVDLLSEINEFIAARKTPSISYNSVFSRFSEELTKCGITNPYAFHGSLKYYNTNSNIVLTKDYVSTQDRAPENSSQNFEIIKNFLNECAEPVSVHDILQEYPSSSEKELYLLTLYYPQVFKWDFKSYCSAEGLPVSNSIKKIIRDVLTELTQNECSYTGEYSLYIKMVKEHPDVIDILNITTPAQLFSIASWYLNDKFYFNSPHILRETPSEKFTTDSLVTLCIEKNRKTIINKTQLIAQLSNLCGRTSSTILLAVGKVLSSYIRISNSEYMVPPKIDLTEAEIKLVGDYITSHLDNDTFVVSEDTDMSSLPNIGIEWRPCILPYVIRKFGLPYMAKYNTSSSEAPSWTISPCIN